MNLSTKKNLLIIVIVLILAGVVIFQWIKATKDRKWFEAAIVRIEHDLQKITKVSVKFPDLTERIDEETTIVNELRKLLPFKPEVDTFMNNLSAQARDTGIEITSYETRTQRRDFFDEIQLEISIKHELPEPEIFKEMISKSERLVSWKEYSPGPPTLVRLNIFNCPQPLKTTRLKPCPEANSSIGKWPFSASLHEQRQKLLQLCADRKKKEVILLEIKKLENIRKYRTSLEAIISALLSETSQNVPVGHTN